MGNIGALSRQESAATSSGAADAVRHDELASYQPIDQDLTDFAALSPSNDDFVQRKSGAWVNRSVAQAQTDLSVIPKTLVDAKGDVLVGTAADTVARKAVGNNYDPLIGDSATSDGLRWDAARGSDLAVARDVCGMLCGNAYNLIPITITYDTSATVRSFQFLLGKLPAGTVISNLKLYTNLAMVGGAATAALYESSSLTSTSWSRLGSNTTVTTLLQATGKVSTGYSATVGASDAWIRAMFVITTAPSTYPKFYETFPMVDNALGGHLLSGFSAGTSAPGATLNPSTGWSNPGSSPLCILT